MPLRDRLPPTAPTQRIHFYLPNLCSISALLPLILAGQLLALMLTVVINRPPAFNWMQFSLLSCEILWTVLIGAAVLCRLRNVLSRFKAATGGALCFISLLLVIVLVATLGQCLISYFTLDWSNVIWLVIQHLTVGGILSGLVLRYFYLQQQLHLQQEMQIRSSLQARFQSLQSRIRPHFLFNSMNSIISLIGSDPDTAERVVEDMSALFRASLSDVEDLVPLEREIDLCQRYINIEQLRLGDRLQVQWQLDLHTAHILLPSLSLQPLIENAIYHGIQPLTQGGIIDITVHDTNGNLYCKVSNPFTEETANLQRNAGNGMALDNLEQRLQARYGEAAYFNVVKTASHFTVEFIIPIETVATGDHV